MTSAAEAGPTIASPAAKVAAIVRLAHLIGYSNVNGRGELRWGHYSAAGAPRAPADAVRRTGARVVRRRRRGSSGRRGSAGQGIQPGDRERRPEARGRAPAGRQPRLRPPAAHPGIGPVPDERSEAAL